MDSEAERPAAAPPQSLPGGGAPRPRLLEVNFCGDWHTVMEMVPGDEERNRGFVSDALAALVRGAGTNDVRRASPATGGSVHPRTPRWPAAFQLPRCSPSRRFRPQFFVSEDWPSGWEEMAH